MWTLIVTIKDCKNGKELWSKIKNKANSMLDGLQDGSTFVRIIVDDIQDGLDVVAECVNYGNCEVSIIKRG